MNTEIVKISTIKQNPNNPRLIKDDKFEKLVKSIKEFPKMLEIRPIVVNDDMIVLGGNMRLKACKEAGLKEVPVIKASELTEEQQREFIIKDNVGFGEWDWDILGNEWDAESLADWGLDVWQPEQDPNYDLLNEEDLSDELDNMQSEIKRGIIIAVNNEHYEEADKLVKFWKEKGAYLGGMLMEYLKAEKDKL